jgi:L-fuculose-phosphate aldolase
VGDRSDLVAAGRRLGEHRLVVAAEGNLSVRVGSERILITPSGRRKSALEEADLVDVSLDEASAGDSKPRPSSDIAIHRAIYTRRSDVRAIVHAHVPAAMALTLAGDAPDPLVLPETALHLPRLPVVAFGAMGSRELATRVAEAFGAGEPRPGAVLLERHGAISVGPDLATALDRMELVDVLCRVWRDARLLVPGRALLPPD